MRGRKRQRKKNCEDLPWSHRAGGHRRNHRRTIQPWELRLYDRYLARLAALPDEEFFKEVGW